MGTKINPSKDVVEFDNKIIKPAENKKYTYILLNKPIDYVTTVKDQFRQRNSYGFNRDKDRKRAGMETRPYRDTKDLCQ